MEILTVGLLILLGIGLLVVEFVLLPGITIAGIAGFLAMVAGVFFAYRDLGAATGHLTLVGTLVVNTFVVIRVFRAQTWKKVGVISEINSKVNVLKTDIKVGDLGESISRIAPAGKAMIGENIIEVHSEDGFIDQHENIIVAHIKNNKVFIKKN